MYNPDNYLAQVVGTFCLLANCFFVICCDLAVIKFPMLLADIQRSIWKSAQGHYLWVELYMEKPLQFLLNNSVKQRTFLIIY